MHDAGSTHGSTPEPERGLNLPEHASSGLDRWVGSQPPTDEPNVDRVPTGIARGGRRACACGVGREKIYKPDRARRDARGHAEILR